MTSDVGGNKLGLICSSFCVMLSIRRRISFLASISCGNFWFHTSAPSQSLDRHLALEEQCGHLWCSFRAQLESPTRYRADWVRTLSHLAESGVDAFNIIALDECLSHLACLDNSIDVAQLRHFQHELLVTPMKKAGCSRRKPPPPPKSGRGHQTLAVEFPNGGISAKAYFFPGMKSLATGMPPGKLILDSIKRLALSGWKEPMHHLCNSLGLQDDGHPTDTAVPPFLLSADLCTPDHCRLKIYVTDQVVSWDRVADT